MTLSIETPRRPRSVLLTVDGEKRATADALLWGPLTEMPPVRVLRMHPHATVMIKAHNVGEDLNRLARLPCVDVCPELLG